MKLFLMRLTIVMFYNYIPSSICMYLYLQTWILTDRNVQIQENIPTKAPSKILKYTLHFQFKNV